ncbi:MAG: hypothetical protein JXR82_09045 [Marinifilaceae bacterium]|nr:hypothetical protein [Marinifilaceae bacterium]
MQKEWESYEEFYSRLITYTIPTLDCPFIFYETYAKEGKQLLLEIIGLNGNQMYDSNNESFTFFTSEGEEKVIQAAEHFGKEIFIIEKQTLYLITNYLNSTNTQITYELRSIFLNKVLNDCLNLVIRNWKSDDTAILVLNSIRKIGNEVIRNYQSVFPDLVLSFIDLNHHLLKGYKGNSKTKPTSVKRSPKSFKFKQRYADLRINEMRKYLINKNYIAKTSKNTFKSVFRGVPITKEDKINWTSDKKTELHYFLILLKAEIENPDNIGTPQLWSIAKDVFLFNGEQLGDIRNNRTCKKFPNLDDAFKILKNGSIL